PPPATHLLAFHAALPISAALHGLRRLPGIPAAVPAIRARRQRARPGLQRRRRRGAPVPEELRRMNLSVVTTLYRSAAYLREFYADRKSTRLNSSHLVISY